MPRLLDIYEARDWNYAGHVFDVNGTVTPDANAKALKVTLSTFDGAPVRYTTDGTEPTSESALAPDTIKIDAPVSLRARADRDGVLGRTYTAGIQFSKATFKPAAIEPMPHPRYTYNGAVQLTDACLASAGYTDEGWLGFHTPQFTVTIDLEEPQQISKAALRANVNTDAWIFDARKVAVAVSDDGRNFTDICSEEYEPLAGNTSTIRTHKYAFEPVKTRYVRFTVDTETDMPTWHAGAGNPSFFFVDEVTVD